jgi:hypothetical protein
MHQDLFAGLLEIDWQNQKNKISKFNIYCIFEDRGSLDQISLD